MSDPAITRYPGNPVLSPKDVPFEASQIFNAGVIRYQGRYLMAFRNDYNMYETFFQDWKEGKCELHACSCRIGVAYSDDGIHWEPVDHPVFDPEMCEKLIGEQVLRVYDPRLTLINGEIYMAFAIDTGLGDTRVGLVKTTDFKKYSLVTCTLPNNRNMLIFPEKINGLYYRLERPFSGASGDIWISTSPDLRFWGDHKRLVNRKSLSFCNSKIGPGAPPVRTEKGWLTLFHTVTETKEALFSWETPYKEWHSKYDIGLMLLDLNDPSKILGICDHALMEPEMPYELKGFRGSVIFPGSLIIENDGSVKIYYGGADTVECLATAKLDDLLKLVTK